MYNLRPCRPDPAGFTSPWDRSQWVMGRGTDRRQPPPSHPRLCLTVLGDPTSLVATVNPFCPHAANSIFAALLLPLWSLSAPLPPPPPLKVSSTAPWLPLPLGGAFPLAPWYRLTW